MTARTFLGGLQDYYRIEYPEGMRAFVLQYLLTVPEDELAPTFGQVLKDYTTAYSRAPQPPDIAVIERARAQVQDAVKAARQKAATARLSLPPEDLATPEEVAAGLRRVNEILGRPVFGLNAEDRV